MSHYGKMIGLGVGAAVGGPVGAVIGAALGHVFFDEDSKAERRRSRGRKRNKGLNQKGQERKEALSQEQARLAVCGSFIAIMAKAAKADGTISELDVTLFESFMERNQYDEQSRAWGMSVFNHATSERCSVKRYLEPMVALTGHDQALGATLLRELLIVAFAKGNIHPKEVAILNAVEKAFKLSEETTKDIMDEVLSFMKDVTSGSMIDEYYQILGCTPEMSDDEIKRQYRSKCKAFHPDTIHGKDLPAEFQTFADQQMQKITSAYKAILAARRTENSSPSANS